MIGGETSSKRDDFLFIFIDWSGLAVIAIYTITATQHNCWFFVLRRNLQNMALRFALKSFPTIFIILFPCMDTILSQTIPSRTIDFSNNILNCFFCFFKTMKPLVALQEKWFCLFLKGNNAHLTRGRALKTVTVASAERLKVFCARKVYTNTLHSDKKRSQYV